VAAGGDEIQVAVNPGLRGVDTPEIVRTVNHPDNNEIENLFLLRQDVVSVEKRSLAFTGTMLFCAYFTTRAVSVAARRGN
jgi:hypothetical protein